MKIERIGETKTIMTAEGTFDYFAWPSIAKTRDGNVVVGCSGFRLEHICPFGKAVMTVSRDEGNSYCPPQVVIDTVLDDRDAGLCPFGKSGLILTSFNNSTAFQKKRYSWPFGCKEYRKRRKLALAYLKYVEKEDEMRALGVTFRVSFDNGVTFGPIYKSPITSPHGPIELKDGTILWVGRVFSEDDSFNKVDTCLRVYTIDPVTGNMEHLSEIEDIFVDGEKVLSCEPYALQLPDEKIVCHIRAERETPKLFTLYQSVSTDNGKTWSKPRRILGETGGAPAHLMMHSSGTLICAFGYRNDPPSIKAIFSKDEGETWSEPEIITGSVAPTSDMGYPASVELSDGSILTVFYAHTDLNGPAKILQQKWRIKE